MLICLPENAPIRPEMPRIDQLLASLGYGSRREGREWIDAGRVTDTGAHETDPSRKAEAADVRIDGEPPDHPGEMLLLMNKPAGLVCSHNPAEGPSVYGLLPPRWKARNPPSRASAASTRRRRASCIVDGLQPAGPQADVAAKHKVPKVYRATLAGRISRRASRRPSRPARWLLAG